jgi:hypothetical protein
MMNSQTIVIALTYYSQITKQDCKANEKQTPSQSQILGFTGQSPPVTVELCAVP